MSISGKPDAGFIFFLLYCSHVMVLDEGRYLGVMDFPVSERVPTHE